MKSKTWAVPALLAVSIPLGAGFCGCSQPDNPTPVSAPPPPAPKPEELAVPKQKASGKEYGTGSRYQKAMERVHKGGS